MSYVNGRCIMMVDEKTIDKLKKLVHIYLDKGLDGIFPDKYFILAIVAIFNENKIFNHRINVSSTELSISALSVFDGSEYFVYYNEKLLNKFCYDEYIFDCWNNDFSQIEFYNYWYVFTVVHEVTHIYQMLCGQEYISPYSFINDMYERFWNLRKLEKVR